MGSSTSKSLFQHCHMAGTRVVFWRGLSPWYSVSLVYNLSPGPEFKASPNDKILFLKFVKLRENIDTVVVTSPHKWTQYSSPGWSSLPTMNLAGLWPEPNNRLAEVGGPGPSLGWALGSLVCSASFLLEYLFLGALSFQILWEENTKTKLEMQGTDLGEMLVKEKRERERARGSWLGKLWDCAVGLTLVERGMQTGRLGGEQGSSEKFLPNLMRSP